MKNGEKCLSIVIPVYNEAKTIEKLAESVNQADIGDIKKEIIIVDDFSTDGTRDILKGIESFHKVIYKNKNEGKGSAVKLGLKESAGDYVVIQDADLEYDPSEYNKLLEPIINGHADVVYGSRFAGAGPHRVLYYWHYVGNRFLTTFSNMLSNMNLTDMETCYKVFNRKAVDLIKDKLSSKRFGIEPEITAYISKNKLIVYEVGISYFGRTYEEGKKINWKDGVAAIYYIFKYNFSFKWINSRVTRFIISGSIGAFTHIFVLYAMTEWVGLHYLLSTTIGFLVAFGISFSLQKFWTFQDKSTDKIKKQTASYFGVAVFNLMLNNIFMYILVGLIGIWHIFSQIITSGSIAIFSFIIYSFIFDTEAKLKGHQKVIDHEQLETEGD